MNVASYDNYMLTNSYLTFCFLFFPMTTLLQLGVFIESNTENSWLRYLNNMCIQRTWADALIIQAVANALNVTIQIVESNQGFAPLTTVYPVQERNTSSTINIGHIDECHYVSTTALQSNATISMCNDLANDIQLSINKHFITSIYNTG